MQISTGSKVIEAAAAEMLKAIYGFSVLVSGLWILERGMAQRQDNISRRQATCGHMVIGRDF